MATEPKVTTNGASMSLWGICIDKFDILVKQTILQRVAAMSEREQDLTRREAEVRAREERLVMSIIDEWSVDLNRREVELVAREKAVEKMEKDAASAKEELVAKAAENSDKIDDLVVEGADPSVPPVDEETIREIVEGDKRNPIVRGIDKIFRKRPPAKKGDIPAGLERRLSGGINYFKEPIHRHDGPIRPTNAIPTHWTPGYNAGGEIHGEIGQDLGIQFM